MAIVNTEKLKQYSADLISWKVYTDAYFIDSLVKTIEERPDTTPEQVEMWLTNAFALPENPDKDNCIDTYNRSFFHSLRTKF